MLTIPEQFRQTAQRFARRPALRFKKGGVYTDISFGELATQIGTFGHGLWELGIAKGERVAILSENRPEWVIADLAAMSLGAISVPVHTTLSSQLIKHILNDAGSKTLIVSTDEQLKKVAAIADDLTQLEVVIFMGTDLPQEFFAKKLMRFDHLLASGRQSERSFDVSVQPDDIASIIYTSGTTAVPKGVMLTHKNFMFDAEAALTAVSVDEHDILLSFLPLSHVLERTAGYYAPLILRGACVAYAESIKTLGENLREVRPTIIISVPRIFEKTHTAIWEKVKSSSSLKHRLFVWALKQEPGTTSHRLADALVFKKIRASLGGRLRLAISGGATLNHKLARFFARLGLTIVEGYGLTETAPIVTVNRPDNIKFGTVGQQLPGVEIKIASDKEILVKGPNVMKGYWGQEALTREVVDDDGWFHTGDLGFMSSDGFLVIIGRKKEMIALSNGKIVWPEQLEVILNNDRLISQSMVHGNQKNYLVAFLVPDWKEVARQAPAGQKKPDELVKDPNIVELFKTRLEKINEQLADWEKIRRFVLVTEEFSAERDEVTPTLKLRRKKIEERFSHELTKLYS